jgi:hypothetical protein
VAASTRIVYAVCLPGPKLACAGMAGEPLRIVRLERLAAVVGEVPRAPRASIAAMRRYDAVQRALGGELAALLPVRFGTCVADDVQLAALLRPRDHALRAALREVRGCVQMTLRGIALNNAHDLPLARAGVDRGSGRAYLQSLAAEARRGHAALEPVLTAVARWVRAVRLDRNGAVASVYHLVPRGAVQPYAEAAQEAADAAGLRVLIAGPFPAYAFGEA